MGLAAYVSSFQIIEIPPAESFRNCQICNGSAMVASFKYGVLIT